MMDYHWWNQRHEFACAQCGKVSTCTCRWKAKFCPECSAQRDRDRQRERRARDPESVRRWAREYARRRREQDPQYQAECNARKREQRATNPEFVIKEREQTRRYKARARLDPERRERMNADQRKYQAAKRARDRWLQQMELAMAAQRYATATNRQEA